MNRKDKERLGRIYAIMCDVPKAAVAGTASATVAALAGWEKDSRHMVDEIQRVLCDVLWDDFADADRRLDELEAWVKQRRLEGWQ